MITISSACTKCGICIEVCPMYILRMNENGPKLLSNACISCGHCVAVCPKSGIG
ncbi:hypothetical protein SPSIL_022750 [Sporomusa silvacetica DSM 10669]|uniref:4Fe-4S ferredoxin-type domain-containing protein n=1 Tax=Sporomusa silvacetica DSM 10669 TaxID=1123289 RepID=A0ABZ3IKC9_9FIRM|nr:ferredoxin [Sporomusa silvacetica DSM 10669]